MTAGVVAANLDVWFLPPTQRFSRRRETGINAKRVQQAIGCQWNQVFPVGFHCVFAGTITESHLLQREGTHVP